MSNINKTNLHILFSVLFLPVTSFAVNLQPETNQTDRCETSVSVLATERAAPSHTLIDVREASEYNLFHIEHSLNMKPHQISSKNYLKNEKVILIGNAYNQISLLKRCKALKQSGFKSVKVLNGGIQVLAKKNKSKVSGVDINQSLYYLTPRNMLDIAKPDDYLVINITGQKDNRLNVYFPSVVTTSNKNLTKRHKKEIQNFIKKNPKKSTVLIVAENDFQYSPLHKLNQPDSNKTIFFLKGGLTELTRFETNIKAILGKKEFTLKNIKGCSN